nr:MAG TPA: hypothetical protein [Bacteriophage sp.]
MPFFRINFLERVSMNEREFSLTREGLTAYHFR